jgi:hypothetical protein
MLIPSSLANINMQTSVCWETGYLKSLNWLSQVTGIWPEQRAGHTGWMVQNTRLFELFSCPIALFTVVNNALTSVRRVFELVSNCWFWCFKYFRIRKLPVPILCKKIRIKELQIRLFQIPQRSSRERICKRTSGYKGGYLFFPNFWKPWLYMRTSSLFFMRIVVISVNHPHNHWWFVLVYDNCPTLVEQPIHMHLGSSHQVPYLHANHLHSLPT